MPKTVAYTCRVCATGRDGKNGWFLGYTTESEPSSKSLPAYLVIAWDDRKALTDDNCEHLCSLNCVGKRIEATVHPTEATRADEAAYNARQEGNDALSNLGGDSRS